jgi:hypothetical protein
MGPNYCHQSRTVSWLTSMPPSWSKSSTLLNTSERGEKSNKQNDCKADHLTRGVEVPERTALGHVLTTRRPSALPGPTSFQMAEHGSIGLKIKAYASLRF